MPRLKLTKSAIDALPTPAADTVYWEGAAGFPRFPSRDRNGKAEWTETVSTVQIVKVFDHWTRS